MLVVSISEAKKQHRRWKEPSMKTQCMQQAEPPCNPWLRVISSGWKMRCFSAVPKKEGREGEERGKSQKLEKLNTAIRWINTSRQQHIKRHADRIQRHWVLRSSSCVVLQAAGCGQVPRSCLNATTTGRLGFPAAAGHHVGETMRMTAMLQIPLHWLTAGNYCAPLWSNNGSY